MGGDQGGRQRRAAAAHPACRCAALPHAVARCPMPPPPPPPLGARQVRGLLLEEEVQHAQRDFYLKARLPTELRC